MSMTSAGRSTPSFIRSISPVPPATTTACLLRARRWMASLGRDTRVNSKGCMRPSFGHLSNGGDDIGIGTAAA